MRAEIMAHQICRNTQTRRLEPSHRGNALTHPNTTANLLTCGPGWQGDGKLCDAIDECATGGANCDTKAICANKPGSFDCACKLGFEGDGKTCKAVLE